MIRTPKSISLPDKGTISKFVVRPLLTIRTLSANLIRRCSSLTKDAGAWSLIGIEHILLKGYLAVRVFTLFCLHFVRYIIRLLYYVV